MSLLTTSTSGSGFGTSAEGGMGSSSRANLKKLRAALHPEKFSSAEHFVERQVLSRGGSLAELKSTTQAVKAQIQSELYEHVAHQYESFVQIASGISTLDADCKNLARPLLKVRNAHASLVSSLHAHREQVQLRVEQKVRLRQRKQYVEAVIGLHGSVTRLEKLVFRRNGSGEEDAGDVNMEDYSDSSDESDFDGDAGETHPQQEGNGAERERQRKNRQLLSRSVALERAAHLYMEAKDTLQRHVEGRGEHFEAFQKWLQRIHKRQVR